MFQNKQYLGKTIALISVLMLSLMAVLPLFAEPQSSVILLTPTVAATSTATATPDPNEYLPDLAISYVSISFDKDCLGSGGSLGTEATIINLGATDAGAFIVEINGTQETVNALAAGDTIKVRVPGYIYGNNTVDVDVNNTVIESNENNNNFFGPVPIPTPPPPCATPTSTPTNTPTPPIPEAVIELSAESVNVGDTFTLISDGNLALGQHSVNVSMGAETAVIGTWRDGQLEVGPDTSIIEIVSANGSPPHYKAGFELQALEAGVVEIHTRIYGEFCFEAGCTFTSATSQIIELTIQESCAATTWATAEVYVGGDIVTHNGNLWRAKWWTLNEVPGTTGPYGVWEALDSCPSTEPTQTPTPPPNGSNWMPGVSYNIDAQVSYDGHLYRCQIAHTSMIGWEPNLVPALWVQQ